MLLNANQHCGVFSHKGNTNIIFWNMYSLVGVMTSCHGISNNSRI